MYRHGSCTIKKFMQKSTTFVCITFTSRHSFMAYWRHGVSPFLSFFLGYYYYSFSANFEIKYLKIYCINLYKTFSMLLKSDLTFMEGKIIDLDEWPWPTWRKSDLNFCSPFCKIFSSDCIFDFTNMFDYKKYVSDRNLSDLDQWPWP